jgi:uncharacterized protein
MAPLPELVKTALDRRSAPVVFVTADPQGMPNAIYCMPCLVAGNDKLILADNYFVKTRANIAAGSPGVVLFLTPEYTAYQVKGSLEYVTSGPLYEQMLAAVEAKHPRVAAVVLHVESVYSGSKRLA